MVSKDQCIEMLRLELKQALIECEKLKKENAQLRNKLGLLCKEIPLNIQEHNVRPTEKSFIISNYSSPEEKIALYNSLFKGRKDVFALRWESKNGKSGYAPACKNEWKPEICDKPTIRCSDCNNRELLPITNQVIYDHLSGKQTIGIYPLLPDETSWFLVADFDKHSWQSDSVSFVKTCNRFNIPAYLERSRSGDGVHVWIFFSEPIPARISRKLGFLLLKHTTANGSTIDFESYDRLFPNQDTMPKGGFGNLIALPLQGRARKDTNTVFVDSSFQSYNDQWSFLSSVKKISRKEMEKIINGSHLDTFVPTPLKQEIDSPIQSTNDISIVQSNLVYIPKRFLPSNLINQLRQLAIFHNPEFYKAQRLRLSTSGIPNVIDCSTEFPHYLALPRGCYDAVIELMSTKKIDFNIKDDRFSGRPIDCNFQGELRPVQSEAAKALLSYDNGILCTMLF